MITFIFAVILLVAGIFLLVLGDESNREGTKFAGGFITVIMTIFIIITALINIAEYGNYIDYQAKLVTIKNKIEIQKERTESVVAQLNIEVARYLKHEQDTYVKMTPESISILLIKYPQLQGVQTVTKLMENIAALSNAYYELRNTEQDYVSNIIAFKNNAFFWFPVTVPTVTPVVSGVNNGTK